MSSTARLPASPLAHATPHARPWTLRGELLGALNSTAAMLPFVLSYGFIVFGVLGAQGGQVGLTASVVSCVGGAAVVILISRNLLPSASPSSSASLILGGAVLSLLRDPAIAAAASTTNATTGALAIPAAATSLALLLAATGLIAMASGLVLMVLGALRAGELVRFVPRPVLAGFMNGVAVLIVLSQLPPLLGLPATAWAQEGLQSLARWQAPALGVAVATAALVAVIGRRWPRAPAPLLALLLTSAAVWIWQWAQPQGPAAGLQFIGPLQLPVPQSLALAPLQHAGARAVLAGHAGTLLTTALLLALIGALESVLNLAATDQQTGQRSNANRELVAVGAANVLVGLAGGLPMVCLRLRAMAAWIGGGRTWRSMGLTCVVLVIVFTIGLPLVQRLPTAVVAGIVVMQAWTLVDHWSRQLVAQWWGGEWSGERGTELRWSLAVVALVCAVTLAWGFVAGVGTGVLAAMLIFLRTMHRALVRTRFTAADFPSRRVRMLAHEALLEGARQRIEVLELEGALFFGNSDRLLAEEESGGAARTDLIVDLRRVSTVDASGAMALQQLHQRLHRRGQRLRLAGVTSTNRNGHALNALGIRLCPPPAAGPAAAPATLTAATGTAALAPADEGLLIHPDLDRAIEAAEEAALAAALSTPPAAAPTANAQAGAHAAHAPAHASTHAGNELPLAACHLFEGLDATQWQVLAPCLRERRLRRGERLFAQGDAGQALYVLTAGSISVVDAQRNQRFASFSAGLCFGETAMLDGGGRTADAVADVDSVVHELDQAALAGLERDHPALCACLHRNLARHLSQRLRAASMAWRRAAE